MIGAHTLQLLMAAGLSGPRLIEVVSSIEEDMSTRTSEDMSTLNSVERRAKWRKYKRNQRARKAVDKVDMSAGTLVDMSKNEVLPPPPREAPEPPRESPPPTSHKDNKTPRARTRTCPPNWRPKASVFELGKAEGLPRDEVRRELAKMRDYEFRQPHCDWNRVARRWLRVAAENWRQANERDLFDGDPRFRAREANVERSFHAALAVARRSSGG